MHDSPKEAAQAEAEIAESTKSDDDASGQAEADWEQIEKPQAEQEAAPQHEKATEPQPTHSGKARK
jgi:hypothetical protein